jgi:hypothetical protein
MNRRQLQASSELARKRAVALGEAGDTAAVAELVAHSIAYRYDDKFQIIQGYAIRPDFYLPRHDVYIEYWGMDTTDYKIGMLQKQKLYQQEGKKLISLYPADLPVLDAKLAAEIRGLTGGTESGVCVNETSGHAGTCE